MMFELESEGIVFHCSLLNLQLVVLCMDEEHVVLGKDRKRKLLALARSEFGNEVENVRFFVERG